MTGLLDGERVVLVPNMTKGGEKSGPQTTSFNVSWPDRPPPAGSKPSRFCTLAASCADGTRNRRGSYPLLSHMGVRYVKRLVADGRLELDDEAAA